MLGRYHRLNGHEFEQTLGGGKGQGCLACCSPWGCKEGQTQLSEFSDRTTTKPSGNGCHLWGWVTSPSLLPRELNSTLSLHSNTEIHWNTRHSVKKEHGARGQMPGFKSTSVLVI